jgi:hypothetical protein
VNDSAWVEAKRSVVELAWAWRGLHRDASDLGLQVLRDLAEPVSDIGQPGRLRAAVEQVDPQPLFQGAHAAAESRLRHVALFGRAREVAAGRQRREVVSHERFMVMAVLSRHQSEINGIGQTRRAPDHLDTANPPDPQETTMKIVEIREKTIPISSPSATPTSTSAR